MKRSVVSIACLLAAATAGWSAELQTIECTIRPIHRSKIHPHGQAPVAVLNETSTSTNWSGYVAAPSLTQADNGTVSYAAGCWTVPKLTATTDTTYCAIWVGIDGYQSGTVEQIGTSHNWVSGAQQNYAWFEMYPGGSYEIDGFPLNVGDSISGKVTYVGNNTFKLVLVNNTQKVTATIPATYTMSATAQRCCAEWIVEAPYSGEILPLSDFNSTTLNYCSATINGVKGAINNGAWQNDAITMEGTSGVKAVPTALMKNGTAFTVKWDHE